MPTQAGIKCLSIEEMATVFELKNYGLSSNQIAKALGVSRPSLIRCTNLAEIHGFSAFSQERQKEHEHAA